MVSLLEGMPEQMVEVAVLIDGMDQVLAVGAFQLGGRVTEHAAERRVHAQPAPLARYQGQSDCNTLEDRLEAGLGPGERQGEMFRRGGTHIGPLSIDASVSSRKPRS